MKKLAGIALLLTAILAGSCGSNPYNLKADMPVDPSIRIGKLDNGLTYYIRHNEEPQKRADFYLIQNVGALLEADDQNGLAHFLEHMAFNGTQNFPGNSMVTYLNRHGVEYGHNINAYTGLSETVYNLNNIPTEQDGLVDSCLLILHDWSHFLTLDPQEIDAERGVILEEMRTTENAQIRMSKIQNPVIYEGSMYAKRNIIGDPEILRTFRPETLRRFYESWYRPDQQAVAIVGDVDVDLVEKQIIRLFADIPAKTEPEKPSFELPDRSDIGYVCATDKEADGSGVGLIAFDKKVYDNTHAGVKSSFVEMLYNLMLQNRIAEMLQQGSTNIIGADLGIKGFIRGYKSYQIAVGAKDNHEVEAFESVYHEVVRAARLGFTQSELDRYKQSVGSTIEATLKKTDKTDNSHFISSIQAMFLEHTPASDPTYYYTFAKWAVESISLDEVNQFAGKAFTKKNMVLIVSGPAEGVTHATKEELLAAMDRAEKSEMEQVAETSVTDQLLDETQIKAGKIESTRKLPLLDAEEWTLSNGAKVVFAKASYSRDFVELGAISKGGASLYEPDLIPAISITNQIIGAFGVGTHKGSDLQKLLAGKQVSSGITIAELRETMLGSADLADLETMFQLTYLRFTQPLFEQDVFDTAIERTATAMESDSGNPAKIVSDSVRLISSNYSPRTVIVDAAQLRKIQLSDIEKIYRERFSDASDFVFILVGDTDAKTIKPLVEKYIASIPSTHKEEKWRDNKVHSPRGLTKREIIVPFETPKAILSINYLRDFPYSRSNSIALAILKGIIEQRMNASIREKEGGTYSISVVSDFERELEQRISLGVQFECDPDNADRLQALVHKELDAIVREGVTNDEVSSLIKTLNKNRESNRERNAYVMQALSTYVQTGIDDTDPKNYEEIIARLTASDIQVLARQIFDDKADRIDLIFRSPRN